MPSTTMTPENLVEASVALVGGSPEQASRLINLGKELSTHYGVDSAVVFRQVSSSLYKKHTGPVAIAEMKKKLIEVRL